MNGWHESSPRSGGRGGILARQLLELGEVFEAEASLLASLGRVLEEQRAGVAAADSAAVEAATGVVLRLLDEVEALRRRRRHILQALTGNADADLRALEARHRRPLPPELLRARAALVAAAREAHGQLQVNRTVLFRAMEQGDLRVQSIVSGLDGPAAGYAAGEKRGGERPVRPLLWDRVA